VSIVMVESAVNAGGDPAILGSALFLARYTLRAGAPLYSTPSIHNAAPPFVAS